VLVKESGTRLICQVQDVAGVRRAAAVGADVIVAQGAVLGTRFCATPEALYPD
jgi:NAD(P)H-dependent flavin oxidoreductase YrpB (nitropropane dioxygenase family)